MNSSLCLITDDKINQNKNYKKFDFILTTSFIKKKNKKIISIPDYIEKNKIILRNEYLEITNKIRTNFYNNKNKVYIDKQFNFFDLSLVEEKNPFKSNSIFKIIILLAIRKIIKENKIKKVIYCGNKLEINSFLKNLNNKKEINFVPNYQIKSKVLLFFLKFIYFFKNIFLAINEILFISKIIFFFKKEFNVDKKKDFHIGVITQFAHIEKKNKTYKPSPWVNFDQIVKKKTKLWCFLYVKTNDFKNLKELKKTLKNNNDKDFIFIHSLGSIKLIIKTILFYCYTLINYLFFSKKNFFTIKDINFYDIFYNDLQKSFIGTDSIKNISNFFLIKKLSTKFNFTNIFYLFENQPHEKIINYLFKNKSKTIGFAHSSIRLWHLSYFNFIKMKNRLLLEPHYICLSKNTYNYTKNMNFNSKIINIEPIRFMNLDKQNNKSLNKKNKKILIIGDILENNTKKILSLVKQFKYYNRNYVFYFKPHIASNIKFLKINDIKIINDEMKDLIKYFDYFICGSSTTGGILPTLNNKRVLFYLDEDLLNLNPFYNLSKKHYFSNISELSYKIKFSFNKPDMKIKNFFHLNKWTKFVKKI